MLLKFTVHSSTVFVTLGPSPATFIAERPLAPTPADVFLPVLKSATSVQLVPFQNSVKARLGVAVLPAYPKAEVAVPLPANSFLAVFKLFNSVQAEPFHSSVFALRPGSSPPKTIPAVVVPFPLVANSPLPSFKSATSVHADPFQVSQFEVNVITPAINPSVDVPKPSEFLLALYTSAT